MGFFNKIMSAVLPNSIHASSETAGVMMALADHSANNAIKQSQLMGSDSTKARAELELEYMFFYIFIACCYSDDHINLRDINFSDKLIKSSAVKVCSTKLANKNISTVQIEDIIKDRFIEYKRSGDLYSATTLFKNNILFRYMDNGMAASKLSGELMILSEELMNSIHDIINKNRL